MLLNFHQQEMVELFCKLFPKQQDGTVCKSSQRQMTAEWLVKRHVGDQGEDLRGNQHSQPKKIELH